MTRWAYHATTADRLQSVLAKGLHPQPQLQSDEARCLPGDVEVVFFCPTEELAGCWGDRIVRFPWPADAQEDEYGDTMLIDGQVMRTNWYSYLPVAAEDLTLVEDETRRWAENDRRWHANQVFGS